MNSPIKNARQSAGLSLEEAAKELQLPAGYLSQIENGRRQVDSDRAEKIARLYRCEREEIFLASRYAVRKVLPKNSTEKEVI